MRPSPLTSELDSFTKVALAQARPGDIYTEEAFQSWETLIENAVLAIDAYIQFSIDSAVEGNATYEAVRGNMVGENEDSKKATLHKALNATQSPKHLEFDSSDMRLLSNDIVRHRVCDLLSYGGRKAEVSLGQSAKEAPLVRADLLLVLQFHRLGDAVNHTATIGHKVRASMSIGSVQKQFVKMVEVSLEVQEVAKCFDDCCIALPDHANLNTLKDNTMSGIRQWVMGATRNDGHNSSR